MAPTTDSAPTAADLQQALLAMLLELRSSRDLTPETLQRISGLPMLPNPTNPLDFGDNGAVAGGGTYALRSVAAEDGHSVRGVRFELDDGGKQQCIGYEALDRALLDAGFQRTRLRTRLGDRDMWGYRRGAMAASVYLDGLYGDASNTGCVTLAMLHLND